MDTILTVLVLGITMAVLAELVHEWRNKEEQ